MPSPATILYVEDEPTALRVHALILSRAGYQVLTATSGKAALKLFLLNCVDLVIVDQLLPDLTGAEVAGEMKRIHSEVPVILFTGLGDPPAEPEQADLLLTKGITPPELLANIGNLIAKRHSPGATGQ